MLLYIPMTRVHEQEMTNGNKCISMPICRQKNVSYVVAVRKQFI